MLLIGLKPDVTEDAIRKVFSELDGIPCQFRSCEMSTRPVTVHFDAEDSPRRIKDRHESWLIKSAEMGLAKGSAPLNDRVQRLSSAPSPEELKKVLDEVEDHDFGTEDLKRDLDDLRKSADSASESVEGVVDHLNAFKEKVAKLTKGPFCYQDPDGAWLQLCDRIETVYDYKVEARSKMSNTIRCARYSPVPSRNEIPSGQEFFKDRRNWSRWNLQMLVTDVQDIQNAHDQKRWTIQSGRGIQQLSKLQLCAEWP